MNNNDNFLPPAKKNSWLLIYGVIGGLVVAAFILITFFRVSTPERPTPRKPKLPPLKSTYALILSPVDSAQAWNISQGILKNIGSDSARTKMVVGSTTLYEQCISSAEYVKFIRKALKDGKEIDLKTQALLFSQLAGIMLTDTLPANLYIVGRVAEEEDGALPVRLMGTIRDLDLRSKKLGKVDVINYLTPPDDPKAQRILGVFKEYGFTVLPGSF